MHRTFSVLSVLAAATVLSGCTYFGSYFEVDALDKATPQGPAFTQELTAQYRDRADYSQNVTMNYDQAYRVADRGLDAAAGKAVEPYFPGEFDLPPDLAAEIDQARVKLNTAFQNGARDRVPKEAAAAQAKLDCWIEDAEKTWRPELYKACRKEFLDAYGNMMAMQGEPVDLSATDETPDISANRFVISFAKSGTKLSANMAATLDQIAQIIQSRKPRGVQVIGHSDGAGSARSKQRASVQRAAAVAESLIARGVSAQIIEPVGVADKKPLVKTKNKHEPANRCVEIILTP